MRVEQSTVNYKVVVEKPPIWPLLQFFFPNARWEHSAVTWGDTIYVPREITRPDVIVHEREHVRQQGGSKFKGLFMILWYCMSWNYRYRLELEAIVAQLRSLMLSGQYNVRYLSEQAYHLSHVISNGHISLEIASRDIINQLS